MRQIIDHHSEAFQLSNAERWQVAWLSKHRFVDCLELLCSQDCVADLPSDLLRASQFS
jgi:hypothetical protein